MLYVIENRLNYFRIFVTNNQQKRNRAKRRKNAKSQEETGILQEEDHDKKIVENDEIKSLDQPPSNSSEVST